MNPKDTYCSHCGAGHVGTGYPRTCPGCGIEIWANPIPVAVVLVPVVLVGREGLLVIRRAIAPIGSLALPGGFIEAHEAWAVAGARECREETGLELDPAGLTPLWFASSPARPDRVQLFGLAPPVDAAALPAFAASRETSERGVIFGPAGLADVVAFSTHVEAVTRYFTDRSLDGAHDYTQT